MGNIISILWTVKKLTIKCGQSERRLRDSKIYLVSMYYNSSISEMDVRELAVLLAEAPESLQLIDVRERREAELASVAGFDLYPLSEFEQWSTEILAHLQPETETIVICHHGMRSAQLCQWLVTRGFSKVQNVVGGIDAYSRFVDSTISRY